MNRRTFLAAAIAAPQVPARLVSGAGATTQPSGPDSSSLDTLLTELGPVPRPEHPRPDLCRPLWHNLNGVWEFAFDSDGTHKELASAPRLDRRILVPFCPESRLSGVHDEGIHPLCWYGRSFDVPSDLRGKRLRLHFGAVDYQADVWLNGTFLGSHQGGYDPFHFDVTTSVKPEGNRLVVRVRDDLDELKPKGKQAAQPQGCMYMHVTGIWQTVWLEAVGSTFVSDFVAVADPGTGVLTIRARVDGHGRGLSLSVAVVHDGKPLAEQSAAVVDGAAALSLKVPDPAPWTPATPVLYDLELRLLDGRAAPVDSLRSYVGFRKISIENGQIRLNGKPFFLLSALDQGYYPDGLYTPRTDEAQRQDVEWARRYGLNSVRKHQIVAEPRYYYWCDRLGLTVWGEMADWGADLVRASSCLNREWSARVRRDINHPSIITWVPTNEQTEPADERYIRAKVQLYEATRAMDPTRPVIDTSGYCHARTDITDLHINTRGVDGWRDWWQLWRRSVAETGNLPLYPDRPVYCSGFRHQGQPVIISEAGNFLIDEFPPEGPWKPAGYAHPWRTGTISTAQEYLAVYRDYFLALAEAPECAGFSYVQLYDVEGEVNGYLTYSREPKIAPRAIAEIHAEILRRRAAIR